MTYNMADYPDIYYLPEYADLFREFDHGIPETFRYQGDFGDVLYSFLLRPIDWEGVPNGYSDIISPYGYGGPVMLHGLPQKEEEVIRGFNRSFTSYCADKKIVSEFVRFHPLLNNADYCKRIYDASFNRNTVAIDLSLRNPFEESFSSTCRNRIRNALKNGVTVEFDFDGKTVSTFYRLYTLTMDKNHASGYYYFSEEFFRKSMQTLRGSIFLLNARFEENIVGSVMFLHHNGYMHYHFPATDPEYYSLACNNLIMSEAVQWGKENNMRLIHLGGGYTTAPDDPLLRFKKTFSKLGLHEFWIGKRIHNQEIYQKLVDSVFERKETPHPDFFPLYRA